MTSPRYRITWKTWLLPLIGIAAFFVYIYIFNVDLAKIIATTQQANLNFYILAAIVSFLDILFFAFAWHVLLKFLSVKISLYKAMLFVWVGIFVDTLIPAESVSGEISKIYLVNKEHNGTAGKATASVVVQRLIGMVINVLTLSVGAALLLIGRLLYGVILTLILFLIFVTFIFLALILLLCVKEAWTLRIVDAVIGFAERISKGRWKLSKLREEVVEATRIFHVAIKEYGRAPKTIFIASFFSLSSWICGLTVLYLVFQSIGYSQISWGAILVISSIFIAVKSVPVGVPFEVGLPEIALSTLFIFFGVPPQLSFTATILLRLLTLWLRFFIGFAAQEWIGIKAVTTSANEKTNPT